MKNQEFQYPIELAAAEDVKCLLQDAMTGSVPQNLPTSTPSLMASSTSSPITEDVTLPSGATLSLSVPVQQLPNRLYVNPAQGAESEFDAATQEKHRQESITSVSAFLTDLELSHLIEIFERELITLEILYEMGHEDLKQIGVTPYGYRHKIMKGIRQLKQEGLTVPVNQGTLLVDLLADDKEFIAVEEEMQATIREHRDNGQSGGIFSRYNIVRIQKVQNRKLWDRYVHRRQEIAEETQNQPSTERMLFHGSSFINAIVQKGFDERHAYIGGMFGAGIYFAEHSSKSNQYVYGILGGIGCPAHKDKSCYTCPRYLFLN